jgi:hypothetical protein
MSHNIRILFDVHLPDRVLRVYSGTGRGFHDYDGNRYNPSNIGAESLKNIEAVVNGTSQTLSFQLTGLPLHIVDEIWQYDDTTTVIGGKFVIKTQLCDDRSQPIAMPKIVFTGKIDNLTAEDAAVESEDEGDSVQSVVTVEVVNRFTLRNQTSGSVLSDVDQKERSKLLNPFAALDRFLERITMLLNKTVKWPNW